MEKLLSITINTQGFESITKNAQSRKSKTYRGLKSQINHNNRTEKMDSNYLINPENTKYNIHNVINNFDERIEKMINDMETDYYNFYKRKMPKNTKPFINGLITFSETMKEDIKKYGETKLFNTILSFLKKEYGNVISIDLHLDETTPHFHFQVLNYDFKKHRTHSRILEKRLRDKENTERRNITQDNLANYLQENIEDFDYNRGKIASIKTYHSKKKQQEKHLKKQIEKIKTVNSLNEKLKAENQKLKVEKEELEDVINNLENDIENIFNKYKNDINELVNELNELNEEMEIKDFYKKIVRYLKNENSNKLKQLIKKMNRKVKAIKKSNNLKK